MTRSQSLVARLNGDTDITDIATGGIWPLMAAPPDSQPTATYKWTVSRDWDLSGSYMKATLEIKSWASDYDTAHELADAIQNSLCPVGTATGFTGELGGTGGILVKHCLLTDEDEAVVMITPDQGVFEVTSQYQILYKIQ